MQKEIYTMDIWMCNHKRPSVGFTEKNVALNTDGCQYQCPCPMLHQFFTHKETTQWICFATDWYIILEFCGIIFC